MSDGTAGDGAASANTAFLPGPVSRLASAAGAAAPSLGDCVLFGEALLPSVEDAEPPEGETWSAIGELLP